VGLPADAIYVEGADNTDEDRYSPASGTPRCTRSTTPVHLLWTVHRGLPDRSLTMSNEYELARDSRRI
jgi:NADH-quinone oxidoreductase subunit I